jgi:hypothetical protein
MTMFARKVMCLVLLHLLGCAAVHDSDRTRDAGASAIEGREDDAGEAEEAALEAGAGIDAAQDVTEAEAGAEAASPAGDADAPVPVLADTGAPSELARSCRALAEASCARLAQCELQVLIVSYGDEAQCEELFAANCAEALARPGAAASADVDACAARVPSLSCDHLYDARWGGSSAYEPLDYDMVFQACGVRGSVQDGRGCVTSAQCLGGHCTYRQGYGGTACGACQTAGKQGAPCGERAAASLDCAQGYYCRTLDELDDRGRRLSECVRTAPVGGVCYPALMSNWSDTVGCAADGHCPWPGDGTAAFEARCISKRRLGESCHLSSDEQQHHFCEGILRCDPNTRTCREGEAELRAAWGGRILGGACDTSHPIPELWRRCRYPALCIDKVCTLAPLPACDPGT